MIKDWKAEMVKAGPVAKVPKSVPLGKAIDMLQALSDATMKEVSS